MHNWRELATEYGPLVWRVAYRILQDHEDAEDCHQEVFVDAMRRAGDRRIENWPAFLHWLAVRRSLDRLRRRPHTRSRQPLEDVADIAVDDEPGREAEWIELLAILRSELAQIPKQQGEVFWLHCVEDFNLSEVAEQLGLSSNHVRVLVHRARVRLREVLRRKHPDLVRHQT